MHYETPRDKWSVCDPLTLWQPNCETENRGRAEQESGKVAGLVTSENSDYRKQPRSRGKHVVGRILMSFCMFLYQGTSDLQRSTAERVVRLFSALQDAGQSCAPAVVQLQGIQELYEAASAYAKQCAKTRWQWHAEQVYDYILFVANTGMRLDESKNLQHRDVTIAADVATGERILEIGVRGKRGVGYCKSMPGAVRIYEWLLSRPKPDQPEKKEAADCAPAKAGKKRAHPQRTKRPMGRPLSCRLSSCRCRPTIFARQPHQAVQRHPGPHRTKSLTATATGARLTACDTPISACGSWRVRISTRSPRTAAPAWR